MSIELDGIKGSDGGIKDSEPNVRKLYWVLTEACNLHCGYCYYNSNLKDRLSVPQRPLDQKMELIDQLPGIFDEVIFTGGEALLDRNIDKLVEEVKKKGLKVDILTNGVLLTEEKINKLIDLKVDCISVSLDSLNADLNDQLRGKSESVISNIKRLLELKPKEVAVEIMMTVSKLNLDSIRDLVEFCKQNGMNLWLDPVEINSNMPDIQHLDLTKMDQLQTGKLEEEFNHWVDEMGNSTLAPYAQTSMQLIRGEKPDNISCAMGTDHFVLETDGKLHPCFSRPDINYGYVYEKGLSAIVEEAKNSEHQISLQDAECVRLGCVCMTIVSDFVTRIDKE